MLFDAITSKFYRPGSQISQMKRISPCLKIDVVLLFILCRFCLLSQLCRLLLDPNSYSADFILNSQMQNIILPCA